MLKRRFALPLAAPLATLALLGGIAYQNTVYADNTSYEPFHAVAGEMIDNLPLSVGTWGGQDRADELPPSAVKLLQPNALRNIRYLDHAAKYLGSPDRVASLVIVQCKRTKDMVGHFPANCYPAVGWITDTAIPRDWAVGDGKGGEKTVRGTEYRFHRDRDGRTQHLVVYNFMVVPGSEDGVVRDMDGVAAAADDYRQRYYGAAQFQLVFQGYLALDRPGLDAERDAAFATLLEPVMPVVDVLEQGLDHPEVARLVPDTDATEVADAGTGR
ncbi:MAG: hypothetical protein AAF743_02440 [Planctomycetota bacterium]